MIDVQLVIFVNGFVDMLFFYPQIFNVYFSNSFSAVLLLLLKYETLSPFSTDFDEDMNVLKLHSSLKNTTAKQFKCFNS